MPVLATLAASLLATLPPYNSLPLNSIHQTTRETTADTAEVTTTDSFVNTAALSFDRGKTRGVC